MLRYIVIALLYICAIANVNESLLSFGLYIATPTSFILSYFCAKRQLFSNIYFVVFTIFLIWICITGIVATDSILATKHIQSLLGVFLLSGTVCNLITDKRNAPWLYFLYVLVFIMAFNYAMTHIFTKDFDISTDRLDDDRLNANILATYCFYATFAIYILSDIIHNQVLRIIFQILFLLMIPMSYTIAILTASRQVLLIQIPLICLLTYIRYIKKSNVSTKIVFITIATIASIMSADSITETYNQSLLKTRNEKQVEDDGRYEVLKEAINVGEEHPYFGVGPGNFRKFSSDDIFSHCSYTEAFANHGVIGVLIYLYLTCYFVYRQIKTYRKTKNKRYLSFFVFGVIFIIYNFFYVFYSDIWLMSFFLMIATNSEPYKSNIVSQYARPKKGNITRY